MDGEHLTSEKNEASEQGKELYEALVGAFVSPAELERMVYFSLKVRLKNIVNTNAGLNDQIFELLTWAEQKGRLPDLARMMEAQKDTPGGPVGPAQRPPLDLRIMIAGFAVVMYAFLIVLFSVVLIFKPDANQLGFQLAGLGGSGGVVAVVTLFLKKAFLTPTGT